MDGSEGLNPTDRKRAGLKVSIVCDTRRVLSFMSFLSFARGSLLGSSLLGSSLLSRLILFQLMIMIQLHFDKPFQRSNHSNLPSNVWLIRVMLERNELENVCNMV